METFILYKVPPRIDLSQYFFITMQADYKIMPKRNGKTDGSFRNLNPIKFFTNYYDISLDSKTSRIYQYSFSLPPEIPQDSTLYNKAIYSIKRSMLKEKIGYLAHSGQIIWGNICLQVPTTFNCKFQADRNQHQLEGLVKLTKQLDLKDLNIDETRPKLFQILNSHLKNTLKQIKLTQLGKQGTYFNRQEQDDFELQKKGLLVLKGFRFTFAQLNSGLFLQIDVCSRVLQSRNLLQIFNGSSKDQIVEKYSDITVISKYGTYRTYKVQKIDFDKNPLSTFHNDKKGETVTYKDYYKEAYGINVKDIKQPLLLAVKSIKRELKKGGKEYEAKKEYVYLVPQFVSPTGMSDDQRADHNTMKALAPHTKLNPVERVKQCADVIHRFNEAKGIIQIKAPKRLEGYCLGRPDLLYTGARIQPDNRGNIKHRGVLKQAFRFEQWLLVYSQGKQSKRDDEEADNAFGLLSKSGQSYGIRFNEPGFLIPRGNSVKDWIDVIEKDVKDNGKPQIIVLLLAPYEQKYYSELKKYITNKLQLPSQFIRRRTLNNPKGSMSAASKIAIQMNVKVGSVPWEVQKRHAYFKDKKVMYGSLSLSKGKNGYTMAFVGTINNECTKVFSDCKIGIKDKENIPVKDLEDIYVNWARSFYTTNNKQVPNLILLYREGLSDQQIKSQLPRTEIPAIENMIKIFGERTKTPNFNPQIVIVTVNKKINSRYYVVGRENQQQNTYKFVPELFNPDSGSIMVQSMSTPESYDFHLAAQYVTQGTCTPTLFKVAYDTSKMPQEALINFTFEQCFNYYNWEGAVRVPACLQCADKLSKLVSQYIKQDIVQSPLTKKHFFL